jgi:hypothetical protein
VYKVSAGSPGWSARTGGQPNGIWDSCSARDPGTVSASSASGRGSWVYRRCPVSTLCDPDPPGASPSPWQASCSFQGGSRAGPPRLEARQPSGPERLLPAPAAGDLPRASTHKASCLKTIPPAPVSGEPSVLLDQDGGLFIFWDLHYGAPSPGGVASGGGAAGGARAQPGLLPGSRKPWRLSAADSPCRNSYRPWFSLAQIPPRPGTSQLQLIIIVVAHSSSLSFRAAPLASSDFAEPSDSSARLASGGGPFRRFGGRQRARRRAAPGRASWPHSISSPPLPLPEAVGCRAATFPGGAKPWRRRGGAL